jgi:hypothetical protein
MSGAVKSITGIVQFAAQYPQTNYATDAEERCVWTCCGFENARLYRNGFGLKRNPGSRNRTARTPFRYPDVAARQRNDAIVAVGIKDIDFSVLIFDTAACEMRYFLSDFNFKCRLDLPSPRETRLFAIRLLTPICGTQTTRHFLSHACGYRLPEFRHVYYPPPPDVAYFWRND